MNEYDKIFYPDRTPAEIACFRREGAEFFESVVRRQSVDHIFWPDREPEEVRALREKGQAFFNTVIRRKK